MKRLSIFLALAAMVFSACNRNLDADRPEIKWAGNPGFAVQELTDDLDGSIIITAPAKIEALTVTLGLGDYNVLANPYIAITSNKSSGSKLPVLDVIDDSKAAAFLTGLGMTAGPSLRGNTVGALNVVSILNALIADQPVENNTSFSMEIKLIDQSGYTVTSVAKFHYTSGPEIVWTNNANFDIVDLTAAKVPCSIKISAPGKIDELTVNLEYGGAPELASYIKNRTTGSTTLIDLINDPMVAGTFKFPNSSVIKDKTDVVLDFGFMYDVVYDLSASTNVFTIKVKDKIGKETEAQLKFKK